MSQDSDKKTETILQSLKMVVPYLPKSIVIDECYEVQIKNVYDPSKFWIVLKSKELIIFMRYLKHFYGNSKNRKIVSRSELKKELFCIVSRNNMYYRSVVLPILLPDENLRRVFMIDFGLIVNVCLNEIFYIFKKHADVPRFSIRACLFDISPFDQPKSWNLSALKEFCTLIDGKRLIAKVCDIDTERGILFVDIRTLCGKMCKSVNATLVHIGVGDHCKIYRTDRTESLTRYKAKVKYLHLFPTFEALESGKVACSLWEYDLLKHSVPLDLLSKNYYQYQN